MVFKEKGLNEKVQKSWSKYTHGGQKAAYLVGLMLSLCAVYRNAKFAILKGPYQPLKAIYGKTQ